MTTAKLVTKCRLALRTKTHLCEGVPFTVAIKIVAIHIGVLVCAIHAALVFVLYHLGGVIAVLLNGGHF